jgi:hypothetical protein
MFRLRHVFAAAFVGAFLVGCGQDQPNEPTAAEDIDEEFIQNSAEMMQKANTGMDPGKAR